MISLPSSRFLNHRPSPFPLSLLPGLSHTTRVAPGVSDNSQSAVLMWLWECPTVHSTYVALGASNSSQYLCGSGSVQQFTVPMWLSGPASNSSQYLCGSRGRRPTVHSTYVALGAGVQQFVVLHSTNVALGAGVQQFTVLHSTNVALGAGVQQFTVPMWHWKRPTVHGTYAALGVSKSS